MKNYSYPITVFTPTFNRAHTLPRVFNSLFNQSCSLFEWLVVDDGSTDNTSELLRSYQQKANFAIRVLYQPNGGKHRAHNRAIKHAQGEILIVLDSDDELVSGALEKIWNTWTSIPKDRRKDLGGLIGHCCDQQGNLIGRWYPDNGVEGSIFYLSTQRIMLGEKLPCYRTDVLCKFPFPELSGSNGHVPEGLIWTMITECYPVRCLNEIVRIYHRDDNDALALMNQIKNRSDSVWGQLEYCHYLLSLSPKYFIISPIVFLKSAINVVRFSKRLNYSLSKQYRVIKGVMPLTLWFLAIPFGLLFGMAENKFYLKTT